MDVWLVVVVSAFAAFWTSVILRSLADRRDHNREVIALRRNVEDLAIALEELERTVETLRAGTNVTRLADRGRQG